MKRGAASHKMHHYVPRSYLARFADRDGFLHIYDRSSSTFRRQRPKEVMKIGAYYRQVWAPPGVNPNIFETTLGEWLESVSKDSIDRLIGSPGTLSDHDTANLVTYFELQRIRVPRQAETAKELMRSVILRLAPQESLGAIARGEVVLTIKDSARFDYMRMCVGKLHPWFGRMEWEVFAAESGAAFVTTDSPVSFYNSRTPPPVDPGLALAGTMVFFPLSSRYALIMRHPEYREQESVSPLDVLPQPKVEDGVISVTHGAVWTKEVVNNFNWKMVQLSRHLVVAESKEVVESCVTERAPEPMQPNSRVERDAIHAAGAAYARLTRTR
jgi:hypothetical protein